MFLLTKVGQQWDEVYSHAVKRLDKPEPIFWMVALHSHEQRDYVRCGDTCFIMAYMLMTQVYCKR